MPMIAITMSSSMSVNPAALFLRRFKFILPPYESCLSNSKFETSLDEIKDFYFK